MKIDHLLALVESVESRDFADLSESSVLGNLKKFRTLVLRLNKAEEFQKLLEPIVNSSIFETDRDSFYSKETFDRLAARITRLQLLISMLPDVLRVHATPANDLTISIKLPDPSDLRAALEDLDTFQTALEQLVVNQQIGGEVRLSSWERGSFWVDLYLGAALAVGVVGSVAWAAAVVKKRN